MIESRSHLICAGAGRVKVLRLAADGQHIYPAVYTVYPEQRWCRSCGCTELFGCVGGCAWVLPNLCSRCFERGC